MIEQKEAKASLCAVRGRPALLYMQGLIGKGVDLGKVGVNVGGGLEAELALQTSPSPGGDFQLVTASTKEHCDMERGSRRTRTLEQDPSAEFHSTEDMF
ncbi:hypothetical protein Ancab_029222 [Ancistrocladus abbreviatus]